MQKILTFLTVVLIMLVSCGKNGISVPAGYDSELCAALSVKIEGRDSLSQVDYAMMIAQNEAVLQYLIDRTSKLSELPDSCRYTAWRMLTSDPEYLERFGHMFTIGSALYQADMSGRLDEDNAEAYAALDDYNVKLADYTDRF